MKKLGKKVLIALVSLAVSILVVKCNELVYFNDHNYIITITDKERITTGVGKNIGSKYLVFGKNENGSFVFENTDNLIRLKWNSSDIQGKLEIGNTYRITVIGYRVRFLSLYKNILKVSKIEQGE